MISTLFQSQRPNSNETRPPENKSSDKPRRAHAAWATPLNENTAETQCRAEALVDGQRKQLRTARDVESAQLLVPPASFMPPLGIAPNTPFRFVADGWTARATTGISTQPSIVPITTADRNNSSQPVLCQARRITRRANHKRFRTLRPLQPRPHPCSQHRRFERRGKRKEPPMTATPPSCRSSRHCRRPTRNTGRATNHRPASEHLTTMCDDLSEKPSGRSP